MTKVYKVEFEAATDLIICAAVYFLSDIAEVVGSNPTLSISSILVDYGIGLSLFSVIVGQFQQQCHCRILHTF
jgi:hypothetical protein